MWNTIEGEKTFDSIELGAEGKTTDQYDFLSQTSTRQLILFLLFLAALCVAFKPDGKEVAVSTLNGLISFFDPASGHQFRSIEGRSDLGSGRSSTDQITAKKNLDAK